MPNGLNLDAVLAALADALAEPVAVRVAERLGRDTGPQIRPRLLSIKQAAMYLGRTPRAVEYLIAAGRLLGVIREGRRVLIDRLALDEWIEENALEKRREANGWTALRQHLQAQEEWRGTQHLVVEVFEERSGVPRKQQDR